MTSSPPDCWTEETSVLITSFWDWTPDSWACVTWTGDRGRSRRDNLLVREQLTDPFVTVVTVTKSQNHSPPYMRGMIVGFYLTSHVRGRRDEFTAPHKHARNAGHWGHALLATRAFSLEREDMVNFKSFDEDLFREARTIAAYGKILEDREMICRLQAMPWKEVEIYKPY